MNAYQISAMLIGIPAAGYAVGRLVSHLKHVHRQKAAIQRILWQEAAERASLVADVRRIATSLERIGLYLHGEL